MSINTADAHRHKLLIKIRILNIRLYIHNNINLFLLTNMLLYDKPIQITNNLYLGDVNMSTESMLNKYGITAVVRFVPGPTLSSNINQLHLYMEDASTTDIKQYFPVIVRFIETHREQGRKVLVHCFAGISRSSTAVIAYLMYTKNMTLEQAYNYVLSRSPVIKPNVGFYNQLKHLENFLMIHKYATPSICSIM